MKIKVGQKLITKDFYISDTNGVDKSYYTGGEIVVITAIRGKEYSHPVEIMYKDAPHLFTFEEKSTEFYNYG
jgi:uncharacterized protein with WD repeat